MFSTYELFTVRGIPIRVHGSLFLFLLLAGFAFSPGTGLGGFFLTLILLALIFGFVLLHELGHSLVALHHGIGVKNITLYPLGGIASLARMPRKPSTEIQIAIAGPLVNFALAAIFALVHQVFPTAFLALLVYVNLWLALFNLLPAFPLDGGRIFRALLGTKMSYTKATYIAARTGQAVAFVLGLLGLFSFHVMLMLIAVFIFFAAQAELTSVLVQERLSRSPGFGGGDWTDGFTKAWKQAHFVHHPASRARVFHSEAPPGGNPEEQHRLVIEIEPDGTVRKYIRRS